MNKYLIFSGIAIELVGIEVSLAYLGSIIDRHNNWPGFALAGLSLLGLAGWLVHVVYLLKRFNEDDTDDDRDT